MTDTPNLGLPYILASQAQKHVTHNEAIRALDCLVQLAVASRTLTSPPASPAEGSRYIVATGATGDWAGEGDKVAAYQDGAWAFYAPKEGWLAWVAAENLIVVYEAAAWSPVSGGGGVTDHGMLTGLGDDDHLQYLTDARGDARYTPIGPATLGINAAADTTNRLALASSASLFNHEGAGHQLKVNKNSAADTASMLLQDGFSGRAEIGLAGDDDLHVKVSPDGTTWYEALKIDRNSGALSVPAGQLKFPATQNASSNANMLDDYEEGTFTPTATFATPGDLAVTYVSQNGFYTKIGNVVIFNIAVQANMIFTTASSFLRVTSLPFAPNPGLGFGLAGVASMRGYTKSGFTVIGAECSNGVGSFFYVQANGSGVSAAELTAADVPSGAGKYIAMNGSYIV